MGDGYVWRGGEVCEGVGMSGEGDRYVKGVGMSSGGVGMSRGLGMSGMGTHRSDPEMRPGWGLGSPILTSSGGHQSRQYAPYWNAFLLPPAD